MNQLPPEIMFHIWDRLLCVDKSRRVRVPPRSILFPWSRNCLPVFRSVEQIAARVLRSDHYLYPDALRAIDWSSTDMLGVMRHILITLPERGFQMNLQPTDMLWRAVYLGRRDVYELIKGLTVRGRYSMSQMVYLLEGRDAVSNYWRELQIRKPPGLLEKLEILTHADESLVHLYMRSFEDPFPRVMRWHLLRISNWRTYEIYCQYRFPEDADSNSLDNFVYQFSAGHLTVEFMDRWWADVQETGRTVHYDWFVDLGGKEWRDSAIMRWWCDHGCPLEWILTDLQRLVASQRISFCMCQGLAAFVETQPGVPAHLRNAWAHQLKQLELLMESYKYD